MPQKRKSRPQRKSRHEAWEVRVILERIKIPDADDHWQKGTISFETTVGVPEDRLKTHQMRHPSIGDYSPTKLVQLNEKGFETELFKGIVQADETLQVRIDAFQNIRNPDRTKTLRYERHFAGSPHEWRGSVRPGFEPQGVIALWKVWYRVEIDRVEREKPYDEIVVESLDHHRIALERELEIWGGKIPGERAFRELQHQDGLLRNQAKDLPLPAEDYFRQASKAPALLLIDDSTVHLDARENPAPKASFGYVSDAVSVEFPKGYRASGTLLVPLDKEALDRVDRRSVRIFRWEERTRGWSLVASSGVHPEMDVTWALTAQGGTFVAVGIPKDPLLRKYVCLASELAPALRVARAYGEWKFYEKICELILCVDFLQRLPFFEDEWGNLQIGWTDDMFEQQVLTRVAQGKEIEPGIPVGGREKDLLRYRRELGRRQRPGEVPTYEPGEEPLDGRGLPRAFPPGGFEPGAEWGPGGICERCFGISFPDQIPEIVLCDPPVVVDPFPPQPTCKKWESIGPSFPPGPIRDLAVHPTNGNVIYAAADAGGLWKTTNGGVTWRPLTDGLLNPNAEAVAVSKADTNLVYMGNRTWLLGGDFDLFVSEDAGATWRRSTPVPSNNCNGLITGVADRDTIYFAGEWGLHKSTDMGDSWLVQNCTVDGVTKTNLSSIFDGNVTHIVADPDLEHILYIAVSGQGILRTMDGGLTWTTISNNLTGFGLIGRTILAVGQDTRPGKSGTNFLVARNGDVVAHTQNAKSANPTWTLLPALINYWNDPANGNGGGTYGGWCQALAVNPDDEDMIVTGGIYLAKTTNATAASPTWSLVPGNTWPNWDSSNKNEYHPDQQSLEWHPTDSSKFFSATDGNIARFDNHGASVVRISDGLTNTWCYNVAVSQTGSFVAGSATYHVGTIRKVSGSFKWEYVDIAEFGIYEIDPNRSNVHFDSPSSSGLKRSDQNGDRGTWVSKKALLDFGTNADGTDRTISRVNLLVFRPDNSDIIFVGGGWGRLHLSQDNGVTWDFVKGPDADGNIVPFLATGGDFGRPTAIAFAPSNNNVIYLGTNNGKLWKSTTGGFTRAAWDPINAPTPAVAGAFVQHIAVHPNDPDILCAGYALTGQDQIFRSEDGGNTWDPATGAVTLTKLPQYPVRSIIIDPSNPNRVFVALRIGVYVTYDGGEWWQPFDEGLPRVTIGEMRLRRVTRTLYLATEGRGVFSRRL